MYPDSDDALALRAFNIVSSVMVEYWSKHSTVTVTIPSVIVAFILHMLAPLYAIDKATDEQLFVLVLLTAGTLPCGPLATVAMTARAVV